MKFWPTLGVRTADLAPLIDVHENGGAPREITPLERQWVAALPAGLPASWVPEYQRVAKKAHQLGRDYGRASATIHQLRGEAALHREEIDTLHDLRIEDHDVIAELQGALDTTRPAPDPVWLGAQIERAWFRVSATFIPTTQAWTQVAETAIDAVRGLWPTQTPDADREAGPGSDGKSPTGSAGERAPVGGDTETSPGGGEEAGVTSTPTGDPAPGDTLAEHAEYALDNLARALAGRELDLTGGRWEAAHDHFRDLYLRLADAVVLAGWRPPPPVDQRPVIAQVLTDHELLADDTCRCGAGVLDAGFGLREWPLWHAEHVATQLLVTGVLA